MATIEQKIFAFDLVLEHVGDAKADALQQNGSADCSIRNEGTTVYLSFRREAGSLSEAVGSAIAYVEKAGFQVAGMIVGEPSSRRVRVAGRLEFDGDAQDGYQFALHLAGGEMIKVVAPGIDPGEIATLMDQTVAVSGLAFFDSSKALLRIEAARLNPATQIDMDIWSEVPRPLHDCMDLDSLRRPQGPTTGFNAIIGMWPGDETDEEVEAFLKEIS